MDSTTFVDHLEDLFAKQASSLADLDNRVGNVLRVKFKLNLFKNYNTDPARQKIILDPINKAAAKSQALECPVLLQNKNKTLPLSSQITKLAVIGSLANDGENQLGTWAIDGRGQDVTTPLTSLKEALPQTQINYVRGYKDARSTDTSLFEEAVSAASQADAVLLFLGQDNGLSGESHSRAHIGLPGCQFQLVQALSKVGKPIAAVIIAGRPLVLESVVPLVDSVLYAWHLGVMAGPALADLITGKVSPSGKLPCNFLRCEGQIPTYYNKKNSGRPNNSHEYHRSHVKLLQGRFL